MSRSKRSKSTKQRQTHETSDAVGEANAPTGEAGRFAYAGLERAIHEKARLGILTSLMTQPKGLLFGELKDLCALTDGNLSRHLDVLKSAGLVEVWKGQHDNRPQTLCRMTDAGRERFREYISVLEGIVADAADAPRSRAARSLGKQLTEGWSSA
jgi:DNA-binding MarR family transcriptional regulator